MSKHLPLTALRTFEVAARYSSFSRAADELNVCQSAVSHQVRHLEEWIGQPLFDRSSKKPRLLAHGAALADALSVAISGIEAACQRARAHHEDSLTIAVIPSVASCWLIPRMAEFRAQHPDITVRIMYAFHGQEIDFRETDFAVIFSKGTPDRLAPNYEKIFSGDSAPVCSRQYFEANSPLDSPERIKASDLLRDAEHDGWADWFNKTGCSGEAPVRDLLYGDFNLLRSATLAGQGVALCPTSIIHDDLITKRLVQLSDVCVHSEYGYYLLEPARPALSRADAIGVFRAWLMEKAARQRAGQIEPLPAE